MAMPAQKPHRSEQDVRTPPEFLVEVQERFGFIMWDLAATAENTVAAWHFGPGGMSEDSLTAEWPRSGLLWLNPPYGNIAPWAKKCAQACELGSRIAMLVPASVGANWFNAWVRPYAYVFEITPRLTFVGHSHPYPKDLILAVYTPEGFVGRDSWHWKPFPVTTPANDNGVDPRQMTLPILGSVEQ